MYDLFGTKWQLMVVFIEADVGLWLSLFRVFVNLGCTLTILLLLSSVGFVCAVMLGDGSSSVTLSYLKVFSIQIILSFSSL